MRRWAALAVVLCATSLPLLAAPLMLPATGSAAAATPPAAARATSTPAPTGATPGTSASTTAGTQAGAAAGTDPDYPYQNYLRTSITGITPTVVTASTGPSITVTGTMTNTSSGTIYDLRYVWQRSNALAGVAAIKAEIARPSGAGAVVGDDFRVLGPTAPAVAPAPTGTATPVDLAAGASSTFVATVAVGSAGLKIDARGVYALTVKVTGDIGQHGYTQYERVGEIHLLGTVLSVPAPAAGSTSPTPAAGAPNRTAAGGRTGADPVPAAVLWPVVDRPHLGVDDVFLDDSLATTIAPGGRLFGVLSALERYPAGGVTPTVVVDPQLLDEIEIMAGGYRVVSTPGVAQAALTPTSSPTTASTTALTSSSSGAPATASPNTAGSAAAPLSTASLPAASPAPADAVAGSRSAAPPPAGTKTGSGQAAATAFLSRLLAAVRTHPVLVLPYSDPDSVAMMRAGLDDQLAALIADGKAVATRILQVRAGDPGLITDTLVPTRGAVNDATLAFVSAHGLTRAVLSPTTVQHAGGPVGAVTIDERANRGAVVTAALTDADVLSRVDDLVARGRTAGLAVRLSTVAALLTGGSLDRTGTPVVISPDKQWTPNAAGLAELGGLLRTLGAGDVVTAGALPALTAKAVSATLDYSADAETTELPPGYLSQVMADLTTIASVRGSLVQVRATGSPVPADLLDPLRSALSGVAAAALRGDLRYGNRILRTVGDTLDGLRAGVSIVRQSPSTLAASTAPLLITVRNDLPYGVRVKVVVIDGAAAGMTTTDPALEDIPEGGSHQFRIDAKVVRAGRFQVHAQIQAADGSNWSAPTTITVNSSAYGALTVVLVAVAGGALTLMVALRLVQRVRHRNDPSGPDGDDRSGPGAGGDRDLPEPDSILAAANESAHRPSGPSGPSGPDGNQVRGDASVVPAPVPTAAPRGSPVTPALRVPLAPRVSPDEQEETFR